MNKFDTEFKNYHYFSNITTRWQDNDIYGHVNNVVYYSYFDTVANQFLIEQGGLDVQNAEAVGFVVASNCQYLTPVAHPQTLQIGFRVNRLGQSSVEYGMAIFTETNKTAVAHGTFTHVFVNRRSGKSQSIPDTIRSALQAASIA